MSKFKEMLSCRACYDLLFEPITLPCGLSVCRRCYRLPSSQSDAPVFYTCPISCCKKRHRARKDKPDVLLSHTLDLLFPREMEAMKLTKQADEQLKIWWNSKSISGRVLFLALTAENLCQASPAFPAGGETGCPTSPIHPPLTTIFADLDLPIGHDKIASLTDIIKNYLNPSITMAPYLQLPYLLRAKALAELELFDWACRDAATAHIVLPSNRRGQVVESVIIWGRDHLPESELQKLDVCVESLELETVSQTGPSKWNPQKGVVGIHDFECILCLSLLYDPITTSCGHTCCRACIVTSVDHCQQCPMCRTPIPEAGFFVKRSINQSLSCIISTLFPVEMEVRRKQLELEYGPSVDGLPFKNQERIPIFVCSLVFPKSTQAFHIFEPRYRVMIKSCMESNKSFGICVSGPEDGTYLDYGTVVEITKCQPLTDGVLQTTQGPLPRFLVEVQGRYRFKVLERSTDPSGFDTALVERVYDVEPEYEWESSSLPDESASFSQLVSRVRNIVVSHIQNMAHEDRELMEQQNGPFPEDASDMLYWIANILPISTCKLHEVLSISSIKDRLQLIASWLLS